MDEEKTVLWRVTNF